MGVIRLQGVQKQFAGQVVLSDLTLELHSGECVGLVGANGSGKTTIFRLIMGRFPPDLGGVTLSRGLEVGYLAQEPEFGAGRTLHDEVVSAFADLLALENSISALSHQIADATDPAAQAALMDEYDKVNARFEAAGGYAFERSVKEILHGLGFSESDYALPMTALSGGQKCRAALAKLLLQDRQFLLLDEPTNHLDIDAYRWLERFLAGHHGGAIVISHDRYLLDRICDRIVELESGRVSSYPGNYSNYVKARDVRRLTQERQYEKDRAFIDKERDFIARHLAGQRSQQAKGRRTRLERMLADGEFTTSRAGQRRRVSIGFDDQSEMAGEVVRVDGLSMRYGEKQLFSDLSFNVMAGAALGITGPNGTGKTTLLRILLGRTEPTAGTRWVSSKASIGYFAQEAVSTLDPALSVLEAVRSARPEWLEGQARSFLGRFLFSGDDVFKSCGALSGGEQSRVRLAQLMLAQPNVLVLDEPTNHLDIPSREALEDALLEFPGTLIAVSHDRYFLDRIVDRLLVMRPEGAEMHVGNYSSYIEAVEQRRAAEEAAAARRAAAAPSAGKGEKRGAPAAQTQPSADGGKPGKRNSRIAKMKLEELETFIMSGEQRIAELNLRFADPDVYRDAAAVQKLRAEFDGLKAELGEAEAEWLERVERDR